jgi:outer membrane protein OmpA-like peptidoglycan-associated protein
MNNITHRYFRNIGILAAVLATSLLVTSCATAPVSPAGSADARSKLESLKSTPALADLASVEISDAEASVRLAEQPVGNDVALGDYRVYMADRTVEIAMAKAATRYAEAQRAGLSQARDDARLAARTREADKAHRQATMAQSKADEAQRETEAVRASAAAARALTAEDAAEAARNAEKLQKEIDLLKAEATDRGLVLTLGNTLFATGRSDLRPGSSPSLDKLVVFLNKYPDRNVAVEGHTDDVGSADMNQALSQHRADSVRSYLMQQGILSGRLSAVGMGETQPIADNLTDSGRQQNRRVEVIIKNPPPVVPAASIN